MGKFRETLRDHLVELGGLPEADEATRFKVFKSSLFIAAGCFNLSLVGGLIGHVIGMGALATGNSAGQLVMGVVCLAAGVTTATVVRAASQFVSLITYQPDLPKRPRPAVRMLGRTWLPVVSGAAVALSTSFYFASKVPTEFSVGQPFHVQQPASKLNRLLGPARYA